MSTQRTGVDWALAMQELVNRFPDAACLNVVLGNLNTHRLSSLYAAFPAPEARRIARKLVLHYTPVHGSWLNIAELELSVLARQCLTRRIPDSATLEAEVQGWVAARNAAQVAIDWRFSVNGARETLHRIYPAPICATEGLTDH